MTLWLIEPHDPLLTRDNRPFDSEGGNFAHSLPIPNPGTLAGAWRTRAGRRGDGNFDSSRVEELKQVGVRGPLLAAFEADGGLRFGVPAPGDATLFDKDGKVMCRRLAPLRVEAAVTDLPDPLQPVGLPGTEPPGKPWKQAPAYWNWDAFERWLQNPADGPWRPDDAFTGPAAEARTHVGIQATGTAQEGALFGTRGMRYLRHTASGFERLALSVWVENDHAFPPGLASVGGERRLASWTPAAAAWPEPPAELVAAIAAEGRCRLFLLTPAFFAAGHLPDVGLNHEGLIPRVVGAVNGRPLVISGWDYATNQAKPTRRAVPAGAVYFLELPGDAAQRERWVRRVWFQCVSDAPQDNLDGYGLAALGRWQA